MSQTGKQLTSPSGATTSDRFGEWPDRGGAGNGLPPRQEPSRLARQAYEMIGHGRRLSARLPGDWDRRARELGKAVVNYRGARRAYGRQVLFGLLGRGSDVLSAPFGAARLLVPADDREIGRAVFATGGYERVYMAGAVEELRRAGFPVGGTTFVDVGANIGTSTIDALANFDFGRAVCFEPDPRSFQMLRANLAFNGLEGRAQAYQVALSSGGGTAVLQVASGNRADNRVLLEGIETNGEIVDVEQRSLDSVVAEGVLDVAEIGLLWIDAQGHEPFVLEGATRLVEAGVPLVLEYTPAALEANGGLEFLEGLAREHYTTVVDLHMLASNLGSRAFLAAGELPRLREEGVRDHTDLLFLRVPPS